MAVISTCLSHYLPLFLLAASALTTQEPNPNLRFGMPSLAWTDPAQHESLLIERPQYCLSYNGKTKTPNWVSWRLHKTDIGSAARGPFAQDPRLPKGFTRIVSHVYDNCGFDRGHMCPAHDRSSRQEDCDATFYMTNVVPQSPNSNQKGWERLESYCRGLAQHGHVLYIACGPAGVGGTGKNGPAEEIGMGRMRVTVPAKLWKVILVLPEEEAKPTRQTRVIAVIMPNDQTVDFDWAKYRVSVGEVEKLTGHKFFSTLDADLANALKEKVDEVKVRAPKSRKAQDPR
jgi:endonuclease G